MSDEKVEQTENNPQESSTKEEVKEDNLDSIVNEFIESGEVSEKDLEEVEDASEAPEKVEDEKKEVDPVEDNLYPEPKKEEQKELQFDMNDVSDEQIADVAYRADTYDELIKVAQKEGKTMTDRFVASIARSKLDPNVFAENKIFSMNDVVDHITETKKLIDPGKVIYPHKGTPEEIAAFQEKYEDIPAEPDGYDEQVFKDTVYEKDEDAQKNLRLLLHDLRLSQDQARGVVEHHHLERTHVEEEVARDMREYATSQRAKIEETYKGDVKTQMRDVGKLLWKHGPDFIKEFGKSKVLKSASFFNLMSNVLDAGDSASRTTMNDFRTIVEMGNTQNRGEVWFNQMIKKVLNHPDYTDKAKNSDIPDKKKAYKRLYRIHQVLNTAAQNRGFKIHV